MSTSILLHRLQNEFHVSLCAYVNFLFYKFKGFKAVKISNMELKIFKFRTLNVLEELERMFTILLPNLGCTKVTRTFLASETMENEGFRGTLYMEGIT